MTAPVNKKFLQEFEEKESKSKSSCLGLMWGRKFKCFVNNNNYKLVRSQAMDDVRIYYNPMNNTGEKI